MTKGKISFLLDKLPLIILQMIAMLYLILIGVFLQTHTPQQFVIKLLIMGLGLFALLRVYDWLKQSRNNHY